MVEKVEACLAAALGSDRSRAGMGDVAEMDQRPSPAKGLLRRDAAIERLPKVWRLTGGAACRSQGLVPFPTVFVRGVSTREAGKEGPAVPELEVQRSDEMSEQTSLPVSGQWSAGWGRAASAERCSQVPLQPSLES